MKPEEKKKILKALTDTFMLGIFYHIFPYGGVLYLLWVIYRECWEERGDKNGSA